MSQPAAAAAVARIAAVTQRYGKVAALDAVRLDIPAGLLIGLIGPDGAGNRRQQPAGV